MPLVLRAQSIDQASIAPSIVCKFDERGGTIGRSDSNTMTLPDPERHVSRLQAEVSFAAGVYSLRNVGSSNPIIVNGLPLAPGEAVALKHQDTLAIGGYALHVDLRSPPEASRARRPAIDGRTVIGASAGEGRTGPPRGAPAPAPLHRSPGVDTDPFADLLVPSPAAAAGIDPFADLLRPAPATTPVASAASGAEAAPSNAARLPDDFDPFGSLSSASQAPPPTVGSASPVVDTLGVAAAAPRIDTIFGLGAAPPGGVDALEAFLAEPSAPPSDSGADDPFAFLSGAPSSPVGPASADHTPELQAAYVPPPVREPARATPAPVPMPALAALPSDEHVLWDAFREGAQLPVSARVRLTPELMRMLGATLRHAVDGAVQLSAARTTLKQEMQLHVTVIQSNDNNPLKFAPDAAAALAMLLQPPARGFLAAPEAMQDVMIDLLAHNVGTIEGTRAALRGMLQRFEPAQLERQLASGGVLDKVLPMNRRSQLWALYLQHFERISEAAREDFHELFGKAFAKAYQAQADRVASARRPSN